MIPEVGHLALIAHLALSFFAGVIPLFGIYFRNQALHFSCKRISLLLLIFILAINYFFAARKKKKLFQRTKTK